MITLGCAYMVNYPIVMEVIDLQVNYALSKGSFQVAHIDHGIYNIYYDCGVVSD